MPQLQHMGKHFPLPLLTPYAICTLYQSLHQCGVRIGLYTHSSRRGFYIGCHIAKGVSEKCIPRLLLISPGWIEQKILLLEHVNYFATMQIHIKVMMLCIYQTLNHMYPSEQHMYLSGRHVYLSEWHVYLSEQKSICSGASECQQLHHSLYFV